jgi:hypothetical protein
VYSKPILPVVSITLITVIELSAPIDKFSRLVVTWERLIPTAKFRRTLLWISVLSLVTLLILLGAAAKHSQFAHSGSGSHYLSKAVKMTQAQAQETCAVIAPLTAFEAPAGAFFGIPALGVPISSPISVRTLTPLLI